MKPAATFTVWVDPREKRVPPMPPGVVLEWVWQDAADYTSEKLQGIAALERKSPEDFARSITHERERLEDEVRRLRGYRFKALVVEGNIDDVCRAARVHMHAVLGTVASFLARSDLPVLFAGSPAGCGRLIAGILKRWEERLEDERQATAEGAA